MFNYWQFLQTYKRQQDRVCQGGHLQRPRLPQPSVSVVIRAANETLVNFSQSRRRILVGAFSVIVKSLPLVLFVMNRAVLVIKFVLARSLYDNNIQSLPNGTFSGMAALQTLWVTDPVQSPGLRLNDNPQLFMTVWLLQSRKFRKENILDCCDALNGKIILKS